MHRRACRDRIRSAAFITNIFQRAFPARANADVEAFVDQFDIGAHQPAHHDVANAVVHRIAVWHPAFLHESAAHSELRRDGCDLAGVVGLHAANRDQRIGTGRDRIRDNVLELAKFVAAKGESRVAVLAFRPERRAAVQIVAEALQFFDGCRAKGERVALKALEHGGVSVVIFGR